jgi:hypothetical protein
VGVGAGALVKRLARANQMIRKHLGNLPAIRNPTYLERRTLEGVGGGIIDTPQVEVRFVYYSKR